MSKIVDEYYQQGRQAFRDGISLRTVLQRMIDNEERAAELMDATDDQIMSFAIGFADELLDALRAIPPKSVASEAKRGEA